MFQGPDSIYPSPSLQKLSDGTVLLIPWELKNQKDNSRYTIAPFMIVNPPESCEDLIEDECFYGYFLRQCSTHMQHHKGFGLRQNLAAPWFIVPMHPDLKFDKFGSFETLTQVAPSDYQYFGVRIAPFVTQIINVSHCLKVISGFQADVPVFKDIFPQQDTSKKSNVSEEKSDMEDVPSLEGFSPRYLYPELQSREEFFQNVPDLPEKTYDCLMVQFPSKIIDKCYKDMFLKEYTHDTKLNLNSFWTNPDDKSPFEITSNLEKTELPKIKKAVQKGKRRKMQQSGKSRKKQKSNR